MVLLVRVHARVRDALRVDAFIATSSAGTPIWDQVAERPHEGLRIVRLRKKTVPRDHGVAVGRDRLRLFFAFSNGPAGSTTTVPSSCRIE